MKSIINRTLVLALALISTLKSAEAQSSARLRIRGPITMVSNTCNFTPPAQAWADFLIKRNTYTISVEDKENNITDPNAIPAGNNTLLASRILPGSNGRNIWYQLMFNDLVRLNSGTPRPLVTMYWHIRQGNTVLCRTIYKGRLSRN